MSEADISAPSSPLLARKGAAAPAVAVARGRTAPPEPHANGHRPATAAPPAAAETAQPDAEASAGEPAPPGSLLSFSLRRQGEAREILAAVPRDTAVAAPAPEPAAEIAAAVDFARPRRSPYRWAATAALALLALAAVGGAWYGYDRVARDNGPERSGPAPAVALDDGQAGAGAAAPEAAIVPPAPTPAASTVAESAPTPAAPTAAESAPAPEEPSFDVVRVAPDGSAVIAGRAEPHTELIVLDNGEPIGTARADAIGEWILIPAAPLDSGGHEFGLVVKAPQGTIALPPPPGAADPASAPAASPQSEATPPIPAPKPRAAAPAMDSAFLVQLASVKSATDATQEWTRLQRDFPDLLSDMKLRVDQTTLGDRGAFFRIRTGPFDDREQARGLCRQLAEREQPCLVIER